MEIDPVAKAFQRSFTALANTLPATITTMTVLMKPTTPTQVDLSDLETQFNTPTTKALVSEITGDPKDINLKPTVFHNSLIFKCRAKEAVKLFTNGNMHVTGVQDLTDAVALADVLSNLTNQICDTQPYGSSPEFTYEVQMINLCYQIPSLQTPQKLDLSKLLTLLTSNTPYSAFYNTERHAGIILRAPTFTLLIFQSGKIILSSIQNSTQLEDAKIFIQNSVNELAEQCVVTEAQPLWSKKRKFDYSQYLVLK